MSADYEGVPEQRPVPGVYSPDQVNLGGRRRDHRLAHLLAQVEDAHDEQVAALQAELREARHQRDKAERIAGERGELLDQHSARAAVLREDAETNATRAEQAEQEAARYKDDHLRSCQLVAELHAAATGRTGEGPRRGVVEDVADVRAERDHLQGVVRAQEAAVASTVRDASRAREQAAECMRETAQLHRQLDSLGTNPDRLAEQVGAGMAVELFGRTYVDRDLLIRAVDDLDTTLPREAVVPTEGRLLEPGAYASTELLEAQGGVFVPVPAGHMLSVTVTPYEDTPAAPD